MALAAKRQAMPWVEVTKNYEFFGANGQKSKLSDLFKHTDELVVYHLMYADTWPNGCGTCSSWIDSLNGSYPHIKQRTNLVVVAKANFQKLSQMFQRKGWDIPCYSSAGTSFNKDFCVEFTQKERDLEKKCYNFGTSSFTFGEQAPGLTVFHKHADGKAQYSTNFWIIALREERRLLAILMKGMC